MGNFREFADYHQDPLWLLAKNVKVLAMVTATLDASHALFSLFDRPDTVEVMDWLLHCGQANIAFNLL